MFYNYLPDWWASEQDKNDNVPLAPSESKTSIWTVAGIGLVAAAAYVLLRR